MMKDTPINPSDEQVFRTLVESVYQLEVKNLIAEIRLLATEMESEEDLRDFYPQVNFLKLELEKKYRKNQKPQILIGKLLAEKLIQPAQIQSLSPSFQKAVLNYASMWQEDD